MSLLTHELIFDSASAAPEADALIYGDQTLSYETLAERVRQAGSGLTTLGLGRQDRVAIYLEKRFETVVSIFAAFRAGGIAVPINPFYKSRQVHHVIEDCAAQILITSSARLASLDDVVARCPDLRKIVIVDAPPEKACPKDLVTWAELTSDSGSSSTHPVTDDDIAAILYTSGSTGNPKGVMLSHRNLTVGARSVTQYLEQRPDDRILAVLPLSFDAGFSQLTTAFVAGAAVALLNYLLPIDVVHAVERHRISGITAVPPLWIPLSRLQWPADVATHLRYIASTGGAVSRSTVNALRANFPDARLYLMYGFTEAFRSTYLDPAELDRRPDSIGKAIPNAELLVLREDGRACAPNETGELVHCGPLVAQGYWNNPEATAERFRAINDDSASSSDTRIAAWSGDSVKMDEEGFLYFVARKDEMIKTSAYRVSPMEVEIVAYESGMVVEAVALGIPHPLLGQAIVLLVVPIDPEDFDTDGLLDTYRHELPGFMLPAHVEARESLPRNPNGKIDRRALCEGLQGLFASVTA